MRNNLVNERLTMRAPKKLGNSRQTITRLTILVINITYDAPTAPSVGSIKKFKVIEKNKENMDLIKIKYVRPVFSAKYSATTPMPMRGIVRLSTLNNPADSV